MPARACLLLLACSAVRAHTLAKEYVCQDPDTGSLHGINTTWRSTTFCGNYTCKIRTVKSDQPLSKVMVNLFNPQARMSHSKDGKNYTSDLNLTKMLPEFSKDTDRLLNKAEIHKITELLHTVKKSDLQAVIELYNVAQEIYKDVKVPDNKLDSKGRVSGAELEDPMETMQNKISYWYEPLNEHRKTDMKPEGPEYVPTTPYPYRRPYAQPYFYTQANVNYPSYFTGPVLSHGDFGRLGYYHPQANPQSFTYPQQNNVYGTGITSHRPCNPCPMAYQYQTPVPPVNYPQRFASSAHQYPPPFYNLTAQSYNNYYKGNPWAYYDYYKNLPYQAAIQAQNNPNAEAIPEKGKADEYLVNTDNKDESWKTDPLTEEVINEIRANIAQRGKLLNIPLKKRIKLERAAKVIKLDQFNRKTRSIPTKEERENTSKETSRSREKHEEEHKSVENKEVLEVYIEKVQCEPTTELGFFKMGNLTKPFPDCCPQKIEDKQR